MDQASKTELLILLAKTSPDENEKAFIKENYEEIDRHLKSYIDNGRQHLRICIGQTAKQKMTDFIVKAAFLAVVALFSFVLYFIFSSFQDFKSAALLEAATGFLLSFFFLSKANGDEFGVRSAFDNDILMSICSRKLDEIAEALGESRWRPSLDRMAVYRVSRKIFCFKLYESFMIEFLSTDDPSLVFGF